jgi:CheY-like chemotaxis protein
MRQLNDAFIHSDSPETHGLRLLDFYQKVHAFTGLASTAGFEPLAHMASAFEALLAELHQKPAFINPSTLQTIAQTLEFFRLLLAQSAQPTAFSLASCKSLVVDDDAISAHALVSSLRKARIIAFGVQDPLQALEMLQEESYSLVLLDIQMPGLDGFGLCEKLRRLPQYERTPIIFVTAHAEFDNRIHSVLSGGNDLIGKPVFPIELAVKAMTHLLRSRLPDPWGRI